MMTNTNGRAVEMVSERQARDVKTGMTIKRYDYAGADKIAKPSQWFILECAVMRGYDSLELALAAIAGAEKAVRS